MMSRVRLRLLLLPPAVIGLMLLFKPEASAQVAGPNRKVMRGVAEPGETDSEIKTDIFLQRQNEAVMAASAVNPDHLLAAANDYRTIDIANDFSAGEPPPGAVSRLVSWVLDRSSILARWLGLSSSRPEPLPMGSDAWIGIYRSCNRGQTWIGGFVPGSPNDVSPASLASPLKGLPAATDPVMHAAHDGFVYVGGMAFNPGGMSKIFVARYPDRNNLQGGSCFVYELTRVVDAGAMKAAQKFLDKPAIAADVPRGGQSFGYVYVAYAVIKSGQSMIHFAHSVDGGETWSAPRRISSKVGLAQGGAIAIDPNNGTVYVAWRDFVQERMYIVRAANIAAILANPLDSQGKLIPVTFTKPK